MFTTWQPKDISQTCSETSSNLTQCSTSGFMYLALLIRLFGGVNYTIRKDFESSFYKEEMIPKQYQNKSLINEPTHQKVFDEHINEQNFRNEELKGGNDWKETNKYDFIIVGAGSAGCVLANRLSEVKTWRVLLIEAGSEEPDITMSPSLTKVTKGSSIDWNYSTQSEEMSCRSMKGKVCDFTRGKTMGGSSAINSLVYMRGSRLDYDQWAELGNHGWSYNELLPYFKKSENNRDTEASDSIHHGTGGPITVERYPYYDLNALMLVESFRESGLPVVDLTAEYNIGTNIALSTSRDGRRVSLNVAYIKPIRDVRKNLDVITNAFATKLIIDQKTKVAIGVTYEKNGTTYNVYAEKEVIVSAGTVNSPKLLMVSGIGPKEHLKSLNISVIADLSVGRNLQDHVTTNGFVISLSNRTATNVSQSQLLEEIQKYYEQQAKKSGPLSTANIVSSTAFIKTKYSRDDAPDIQFVFESINNVKEFYSDPQSYLLTDVYTASFYDGISCKPLLLVPQSRGIILLNDTDPVYGDPLIYQRFFTVKKDIDVLVEGFQYAVSLEETESFKQSGAHFERVPIKNCESHIWGSYDYFECLLFEYTATIYHPVGTCKMGPSSDKEAVVDPTLQVYGVKRLRVVDASVMPFIPRGNINIPTVTIAERAADMIKSEHNQ